MKKLIEKLGAKRFAALLLGPGIFAVGIDSAIAHFAGKGVSHPAQLVPLAYGAAALVLVVAVALPKLPASWFRRGLRVAALASAAVGAAGTFFHLRPMLEDLADEGVSLLSLEGALAVAPPLFAPGAFVILGALLWVIASPRVELRVVDAAPEEDAEHAAVSAASVSR